MSKASELIAQVVEGSMNRYGYGDGSGADPGYLGTARFPAQQALYKSKLTKTQNVKKGQYVYFEDIDGYLATGQVVATYTDSHGDFIIGVKWSEEYSHGYKTRVRWLGFDPHRRMWMEADDWSDISDDPEPGRLTGGGLK